MSYIILYTYLNDCLNQFKTTIQAPSPPPKPSPSSGPGKSTEVVAWRANSAVGTKSNACKPTCMVG